MRKISSISKGKKKLVNCSGFLVLITSFEKGEWNQVMENVKNPLRNMITRRWNRKMNKRPSHLQSTEFPLFSFSFNIDTSKLLCWFWHIVFTEYWCNERRRKREYIRWHFVDCYRKIEYFELIFINFPESLRRNFEFFLT